MGCGASQPSAAKYEAPAQAPTATEPTKPKQALGDSEGPTQPAEPTQPTEPAEPTQPGDVTEEPTPGLEAETKVDDASEDPIATVEEQGEEKPKEMEEEQGNEPIGGKAGEELGEMGIGSMSELAAKKAQLDEMMALLEKLEGMDTDDGDDQAEFASMMSSIAEVLETFQPQGEVRVATPKTDMPSLVLEADPSISRRDAEAAAEAVGEKLREFRESAEEVSVLRVLIDAGLLAVCRWGNLHSECVSEAVKLIAHDLVPTIVSVPHDLIITDGDKIACDDPDQAAELQARLKYAFLSCKLLSCTLVFDTAFESSPELISQILDAIIAADGKHNTLFYLCRAVLAAAESQASELTDRLFEVPPNATATRLSLICRMVSNIAVQDMLSEMLGAGDGSCQYVAVRLALMDAGIVQVLLQNFGIAEPIIPGDHGEPNTWSGTSAVIEQLLWCADDVETCLCALISKAAAYLDHPQASELFTAPIRFVNETDLSFSSTIESLPALVAGFRKGNITGKTRLMCTEWLGAVAKKSAAAAMSVLSSGGVATCIRSCQERVAGTMLHVRVHGMMLAVLRHSIHSSPDIETAVGQLEKGEVIEAVAECAAIELRSFVVYWGYVLVEWSKREDRVKEWLSAQPGWVLLEQWTEDSDIDPHPAFVAVGLAEDEAQDDGESDKGGEEPESAAKNEWKVTADEKELLHVDTSQ